MFGDRVDDFKQVVSIETVNLQDWVASGISRHGAKVFIKLDIMPSGVLNLPTPGEQWLVDKILGGYVLTHRVGYQDTRFLMELDQGGTVLGRSGDTRLSGSRVLVEAEEGLFCNEASIDRPSMARFVSRSGSWSEKSLDQHDEFEVQGLEVKVPRRGVYEVRISTKESRLLILNMGGSEYFSTTSAYLNQLMLVSDTFSTGSVPDGSILEVLWRSN